MSLFDDLPEPTNTSNLHKDVDATTETTTLKRKSDIEHNTCPNKKKNLNFITFKSFVSSRKGEREDMQDAHISIDNFTDYMKKNYKLDVVSDDVVQNGFYGVYDGHNGCKASNFASENLHKYLANVFPRGDCQSLEVDIKRIFTDVYKKTDEEFLKIASKQRPHLRDGSTAVNVLIINRTMYIANIGDSKAVLARQCKDNDSLTGLPLTKDHTAIDYDERLRLQKHGSIVRDGRLNGTLEISRSFGDYQYKKQGVTCIPDVKKCRITDSDKFLIIACDGLWKTFSPQEAVEFVRKIISVESSDMSKRFETACNKLCNEAVLKMSGDNVTVMIVAFNI